MSFMEFFASVTSASSKNNAAGSCISFSSEPLVDSNLKPLDLSHGQWYVSCIFITAAGLFF